MTPQLSIRDRTNLFVSNLAGHLRLDNRVPISLVEDNGLTLVRIPDREIAIPAARRWHRYKRGWDKRTARLLFQFGVGDVVHLSPGDTVIDIGANIGEFSLGVAALGMNVHAIEGDPLVFRCLSRNCATAPNVMCHQNVVWKEDTRLTFYSEPTDADSSVFKPDAGVASTALEVDARSLDSIALAHGIDQVGFLKCDAEGAEPEVIEGGRSLLSRTRAVAFDTGAERMGEETSAACEVLLRELGFKVHHDRRPNRKITFGIRS